MAKLLTLGVTTAINLGPGVGGGATPFVAGRNVLAFNPTASPIALTQSPDNVASYTALATVPANSFVEVTLPNYIKTATAGILLID